MSSKKREIVEWEDLKNSRERVGPMIGSTEETTLSDADRMQLKEALKNKIREKIKSYTERRDEGEDIQPWQAALWIERVVESALAKIFVEKGLRQA